MARKSNTVEYILNRIENETMPIPESGCLIWLGTVIGNGYGAVSFHGKHSYGLHRFVYEQKFGPIPSGMVICHKCDTPSCLNINHLFLGTYKDNRMDAIKKGRKHGDGAKNYAKGSLHIH